MIEFLIAAEWFMYGFIAGITAVPGWHIARRVWQEAKLAREEWGRPRG